MDLQHVVYAFEIIFGFSLTIVFYTYIGYGLLLAFLVQLKRIFVKPEGLKHIEPSVTIIIAAYNEEEWIEQKLKNTLRIDYPSGKIQVIVNCEGSTDRTGAISRRYSQVQVIDGETRTGKIQSINRSVSAATGEILLFTDANSVVDTNMVRQVVRHFSVPHVGGVAGEKRILPSITANGTDGEGFYWRYESLLKKLDSDLYTSVGAAGELFAMRKELWENLPADTILEDFVQSLKICEKGYVVRYEPTAVAYETPSTNLHEEMKRKVRICAGGFQAMGRLKRIFNIFRYPVLSFQFISHRVLRWSITPLALVVMLVTNLLIAILSVKNFYIISLIGQLLFYALALAGWLLSKKSSSIRLFTIPFYFVFMNVSVFLGFLLYRRKAQTVLWERASRQKAPLA